MSPLTLGKSRIEALSDGIFSITMTLLVLKLEVPPVMHHMSGMDLVDQLIAIQPAFVTYVATFLIAGGFWFLHHISFHFIRHANAILVWINLLFLMMVSLLPFSAGLMSHLLVHPVSQLFYYGNLVSISLLLCAHWIYARACGLVDSTDRRRMRILNLRIGSTAVAFGACLGAAAFAPNWSWVPLPLVLGVGLVLESR